jgi:hypothetical protein
MPSIKFTEIELGFLRNHYEQELIDAEMYVAEIRKILAKFGTSETETPAEKPAKKRRGRPAKNAKPATEKKPVVLKEPKKKKARKARRKKAKVAKSTVAPKAVVKKTAKKTVKKAAPKKPAVKKAVKAVETPAPAEQQL